MSDIEETGGKTVVPTFGPELDKDDLYQLIQAIARNPSSAKRRQNDVFKKVDEIRANGQEEKLFEDAKAREGETILHMVVRSFSFRSKEERRVTKHIINAFPELIQTDRNDTQYEGQTPFHMAVCKGNVWLVGTMLKQFSENSLGKETLLEKRATGKIFRNTVMIGEIPLSIAALTFNKGMYDLLLRENAKIDGANHTGDNVCHSLIRYTHLYPDKLDDALEMVNKINEDPAPYANSDEAILARKLRKKIWVMENDQGMNPLQLAASLGLHQIFAFIMELDVYCFENSQDGLFDIKIYDVTEIDAVSSISKEPFISNDTMTNTLDDPHKLQRTIATTPKTFNKSVLMMLYDLDPTVAFQFMLFPPVRRIIAQKWNAYKKVFYLLWFLYLLFMGILSWFAIERSKQSHNAKANNETNVFDTSGVPAFMISIQNNDGLPIGYSVLSLMVALVVICQEVIRSVRKKITWSFNSFRNPYSNGWFRVLFLLFAIAMICDFMSSWSERYENYCLYVAVICGYYLVVFFLRTFGPFSLFTVLIQKALISDMVRFFVIILLELVAFSITMHMSIQGSDAINDVEYSNYSRVLFSMVKLMVGLGDTPNVYDTRHPVICNALLIGFIVMTTLLMMNALIAMMGRTCMELVENVGNVKSQERHRILQRLSVVLFFESILPDKWVRRIGKEEKIFRYNNETKRRKLTNRYLLEVRSLQSDEGEGEEEDVPSTNFGFRTTVVNALRSHKDERRDRPSSGLSDRIRQVLRREKNISRTKRKQKQNTQTSTDLVPVQVQPPVSQVFGMNPRAAEGWTENGFRSARELDIYHFRHCGRCLSTEHASEDCFDPPSHVI